MSDGVTFMSRSLCQHVYCVRVGVNYGTSGFHRMGKTGGNKRKRMKQVKKKTTTYVCLHGKGIIHGELSIFSRPVIPQIIARDVLQRIFSKEAWNKPANESVAHHSHLTTETLHFLSSSLDLKFYGQSAKKKPGLLYFWSILNFIYSRGW